MATLMEKDVLIEITVDTLASISRKIDDSEEYENNADRNRLLEIRKFLYCTFPHKIDYQKVLTECLNIERKYVQSFY